jgi:hypothetical protein
MASKKYRRSGTNRKRGASTKSKNCSKGGRKSSRRARTDKKKRTHKWHQKGCQSGGGSMTGGWPWGPSDVHHSGGGGGAGGQSPVPQSINGNHYSLNSSTMAPPQSSNHLVEKGQYGGKRRRHPRRYVGEQHGGAAEYLPESANTTVRGVLEIPASITNALQGASTAFKTSDPTIQPIGQPVQLK